MNGQWRRQRGELTSSNVEKSDQWMKFSGINYEAESLICAAQEQTLATNYVRKKIWK